MPGSIGPLPGSPHPERPPEIGFLTGPSHPVRSVRLMTDIDRVPGSTKRASVERVPTLGSYRGEAGRMVRALKFGGDRRSVASLGAGLAELALAAGVVPDVVTWVPTTVARRGRRGVDQARVLAGATGRALGRRRRLNGRERTDRSAVPVRRLLLRAPGGEQTGRTGAERRRGPELRARSGVVRVGSTVVLVDDVVTTGATMDAAVAALQLAGAGVVIPVAVAGTPRRTFPGAGRR